MVDFECKSSYDLDDFRKVIAILRSPGGCPWDIEQTHESIRRNLLEEAYEVCEAIDERDPDHLKEELGDLLMQVIFHSRIEEEKGVFNLDDVADAAVKKLIFRHPHVFGDVSVSDSGEVLKNWDELKRREKAQTTVTKTMTDVAESLPSLWRAEKVQKKACKVGFDWEDCSGAQTKLTEELNELNEAIAGGDKSAVEEELGDLLLTVTSLARKLGVDSERALSRATDKFIDRFERVEQEAEAMGKHPSELSMTELDAIWDRIKHEKM